MIHDYDEQELPAQHIYHHTAPFFRECRAYGTLIKVGLNGRYAARCHGHLAIPAEQAKQLIHFFPAIDSWNVPAEQSPEPRPAIVKEILEETSQSNTEADRQAIEASHQAGITTIGDVGLGNLKNGKIYSFSKSETRPYFRDELRDSFDAEYCRQYDFAEFDKRLEESE